MSQRSILSIPTFDVVESREIPFRRLAPVQVSAAQDPDWAKTALFGGLTFPPAGLRLVQLTDAYFVIGAESDGIVFDSERTLIEETAYFTPSGRNYDLDQVTATLDDVFIGFDAAWTNYFHWLCYALPKAVIAMSILGESAAIVFPDLLSRLDAEPHTWQQLGYTAGVWTDSLAQFGLAKRCTLLGSGIYRANRVYMLWPQIESPTEFIHTSAFRHVFDMVRKDLPNLTTKSREVYISRAHAPDRRLEARNENDIHAFCRENGIEIVKPETLSFSDQMRLFNSAELVIAPHGAGLTNMVFGTARLQVLELNRRIGSDDHLRPWFYMIASCLNLTYAYLDGTAHPFSVSDIAAAVTALRSLRRSQDGDF